MLVPAEGLAGGSSGISRGRKLHRNFGGSRSRTARSRFRNRDRVCTVHGRSRIAAGRVLVSRAEVSRTRPGEGHAGSLGSGRKFNVTTRTRGYGICRGCHRTANRRDGGGVLIGTVVAVFHGDYVVTRSLTREDRTALVSATVERVAVLATNRRRDRDAAVRCLTAGVVYNRKRRNHRLRIDGQVQGIDLRTSVVIQMTVEVIAAIRDDSIGATNPFPSVTVAHCNRDGCMYRIVDRQM